MTQPSNKPASSQPQESQSLNDYQPIRCSFHDVLEANATLSKKVEIVYREEDGKHGQIKAIIKDIFNQNKAEYLKLHNGQTIRLDQLISVDGVALKA